ncbi:hypothetical protein FOXYSP1_10450 [Fusarium oxysporum f. sp. phaseoli]
MEVGAPQESGMIFAAGKFQRPSNIISSSGSLTFTNRRKASICSSCVIVYLFACAEIRKQVLSFSLVPVAGGNNRNAKALEKLARFAVIQGDFNTELV